MNIRLDFSAFTNKPGEVELLLEKRENKQYKTNGASLPLSFVRNTLPPPRVKSALALSLLHDTRIMSLCKIQVQFSKETKMASYFLRHKLAELATLLCPQTKTKN